MTGRLGNREFCFPENRNASRDEVETNKIHSSPRMLLSFATCTCSAQFLDARNNNCVDKAFGFPTALVNESSAVGGVIKLTRAL